MQAAAVLVRAAGLAIAGAVTLTVILPAGTAHAAVPTDGRWEELPGQDRVLSSSMAVSGGGRRVDPYVVSVGSPIDPCGWTGRLSEDPVRIDRRGGFQARIVGGTPPTATVVETRGRFTSSYNATLTITVSCVRYEFDLRTGQSIPIPATERYEVLMVLALTDADVPPLGPWYREEDDVRTKLVVRGRFKGCRDGYADEQATINYDVVHRRLVYTGNWVGGAPEIRELGRNRFHIGSIDIRATTCRTRRAWRFLGGGTVEASSAGLDRKDLPRGKAPVKGWGVGVESGRDAEMTVGIARCKLAVSWQKVFKTILGFPWPTKKWGIGVGLWVGEQVVPEPERRTDCARVGELPVALRITPRGRLGVVAADLPAFAVVTGDPKFDTFAVEAKVFAGD